MTDKTWYEQPTTRDLFAIHAPKSVFETLTAKVPYPSFAAFARVAYEYADAAMIEARKQTVDKS